MWRRPQRRTHGTEAGCRASIRIFLDPTDKFPSELSCAEASVSSPQAMTANLMAATLTLCMLYNIIAGGELTTRMTTFSSKTVNVRPLLSKRRAA